MKSKLLQADNYKDSGDEEKSNQELLAFVENYDYFSGIEITEEDLENSFFYFETSAREYERKGKLRKSVQNFIYNNLLLSLAKERKLPIGKTYRDYSVFYQKMMIDNSFKHSQKLKDKSSNNILNKFR